MIQSLLGQVRQAENERDVARKHRDEAMRQFEESMSMVRSLRKQLTEIGKARDRYVGERDCAIYHQRGAEQRLQQVMCDYQWAVDLRRNTMSEREKYLKIIDELKHDRNRGWNAATRLKAQLDLLQRVPENSLQQSREVVRHAPLSLPIVAQRKAAKIALEKNSLLKKQKPV